VETFANHARGYRQPDEYRFDQIIGASPAIESVLKQVERVAPTQSTVLIHGETGTGKELVARAIHTRSPRCGRAFVKVNCAAIPLDLLESELFGHEKGAFTGAIAQKIGRFEAADRGTLFLDEVGDIPLPLQPKLLRVLQEQEFERLGSTQTHRVNVRLIAATNRDLEHMVRRSEYRIDLYYRFNVFPISIPPLRERREDIPALVSHCVERFSARVGKRIQHVPPETLSAFMTYDWPGNIRELQNAVERAVIMSDDGVLPNPLPPRCDRAVVTMPATTLHEADRTLILNTLESVRWVVAGPKGAARKLGLNRNTLISKMRRLGISRPQTDEPDTVTASNTGKASDAERSRCEFSHASAS
jgi:formate hydrogenlyase transcriptional activator